MLKKFKKIPFRSDVAEFFFNFNIDFIIDKKACHVKYPTSPPTVWEADDNVFMFLSKIVNFQRSDNKCLGFICVYLLHKILDSVFKKYIY